MFPDFKPMHLVSSSHFRVALWNSATILNYFATVDYLGLWTWCLQKTICIASNHVGISLELSSFSKVISVPDLTTVQCPIPQSGTHDSTTQNNEKNYVEFIISSYLVPRHTPLKQHVFFLAMEIVVRFNCKHTHSHECCYFMLFSGLP